MIGCWNIKQRFDSGAHEETLETDARLAAGVDTDCNLTKHWEATAMLLKIKHQIR